MPDGDESEPYVFVSYSHHDREVVGEEVDWLKRQGLHVLWDMDVVGEKSWDTTVAEKMAGAKALLFYVSEHALDSAFCEAEYAYAWQQKLPIFLSFLDELQLSREWDFRFARVHLIASRQVLYRTRAALSDYRARLLTRIEGVTNPNEPHSRDVGSHPTIAVLRFSRPDSSARVMHDAFIADTVSMNTLTLLSSQPRIRVIPQQSSFALRGEDLTPQEFGAKLGANEILTGKVFDNFGAAGIRAKLTSVQTGEVIFDEEFELSTTVTDSIVQRILRYYAQRLNPGSVDSRIATYKEEAYLKYVQGQIEWARQDIDHLKKAKKLFKDATEIDERYIDAHIALAQAHIASHSMGTGSAALEDAIRVIENARAFLSSSDIRSKQELELCSAYCSRIQNWITGLGKEELIVRGLIESNPSDYTTYAEYGEGILMHSGFYYEAIAYLEVGEMHETIRVTWKNTLALLYAGIGELDMAHEKLTQSLALDSENGLTFAYRSVVAARLGQTENAGADLKRAILIAADNPMLQGILQMQQIAIIDYRSDADKATLVLRTILDGNMPGPACKLPFLCGLACFCVGDLERGFEYWQWANANHDRLLHHARTHLTLYCEAPLAQQVANDPRYTGLMDGISMGNRWSRELSGHISSLTPLTGISSGKQYFP